jgi:ectoine hydroxylase-related dioxygenase (phytanoyl-CoA dioxygenase family)
MLDLYILDIEKYKKVSGSLWRLLDVYQLMHDERIIDFLHKKFKWGGDIFVPGGQVVHIMANELQIPNGYFGLGAHQDFPSVQGSLDGVVVWVPLVDVDKSNFPLEVIPRSHKRGLLPMNGEGQEVREVDSKYLSQDNFSPIEVNVGDVVFMSMFTIHKSSGCGTNGRVRLATSTRFDNAAESTFIDRCYPTAYTRQVCRDQFYKNFPTEAHIQDIFSV